MNKLKFLTLTIIFVMAAVFVAPRLQTAEAAAPANDDFYSATVIPSLPYSETLNTSEASAGSSDPYPCGYYPYSSVWYSFTPGENMTLRIGTNGSNYYTAVGIYTGSYGNLTEMGCNSYNNNLDVSISGGTTYYIQIVSTNASYPGPGGNTLQFSLTQLLPPANDNFADAKIVDTMPYQDTVDNTYATSEPGEPAGCAYSGPVKTFWYAYTPTSKGLLSGNTSYYPYPFLAVYTGNSVDSLTQINCTNWGVSIQVNVSPGTTYYLQVGSLYPGDYGNVTVYLNFTPAPPNDDFANAMVVGSLPFTNTVNNYAASTEPGEPSPDCIWDMNRTIWYSYTPGESGSYTFQRNGFYYGFMAVYTGSALNQLTQLWCAAFGYDHYTLHLDQGVTYYIQLGSSYYYEYGDITLNLSVPPPPNADFWWSPGDPNRFDTVQFCDNSDDPGGQWFTNFWWDFGDGSQLETTDGCVNHQFMADGDYSVWHKAQTDDGRTGEITKVVAVRTHDVAITKFSVPQSSSVGQTRQIVVGIRNSNYPENVTVELYKSTPYGYTWVGSLNMSVPVRPSNRTTDFKFSYTFTNDDGKLGKVTFKAIAILNNARDALSADNEAISLPTKVTGYKPYSATIVNPSNMTGVASTFGLLALGLAFGAMVVKKRY